MRVPRNLYRREATAPGTCLAGSALQHGDFAGYPLRGHLSSSSLGAMATESGGNLVSGSRRTTAWKLPGSKDAESRAPSPTRLRVSGFNSVCQGTHILFREFSFIQATPHNRASFLRAFWRCFRTVGKNGDLLTMREYHCLLQLLCPDFPLELTQKAARIVLMDDAMDCLMSFSDFLFAFQIQFYYSEFLDSVAAIYQDLLLGKNPNTVIVPTSSSGLHRQRPALGEAGVPEGVEASLFYQCLENLCDRHKYSCPPLALVKEILSGVQRLTFYGFLGTLSKHPGINQALGALPDKGDLMQDPAMDEELERLVVRSRLHRTPRQHRAKEPGAAGTQRRDKLEAPERAPEPSRWQPE
ncbi:PREDICTED: UPF0705 protein C11orf49 homolog isoform X2 [Chinchilla lanigera]|uniref:UPF0705 protein C11orf49 homolog isoform X2 n=1 Tax=Chinchilla lanigera TaxID=34839 RepID=UPI0006966308|nr:PREDICTED: UPF0705 protein C11orf49 homolog isoform X2 [Chinchilla lanigera]